jgi:hypothetical protein
VVAGGVVTGSDPASSLLVQQALREARLCLQRGEAGTAVRVLERQLPHINGDAAYLELLGQAYEAYLNELHQLGRTDLLPTYLDRLAIINPSRAGSLRERWQVSPVNELAAHRIVARGRMDDEPPLSTVPFGRFTFLGRRRLHAGTLSPSATPLLARLSQWTVAVSASAAALGLLHFA